MTSSNHHSVDFQWINTSAELQQLCQHLSQQVAIAIDTEFMRSRTFFPHIGLLQIADDQGTYLIDPLAIEHTQALSELLVNPSVVKVIHACSEDLEVFQHAFGVLPNNVFDTQIAAAFCGYGSSIGYANLLKIVMSIDIPKQETRSDWLQRPLSDSQLNYAALDVEYLLSIYNHVKVRLEKSQRLSWVVADSQSMVEKLKNTDHADQYYLRINSAWKLKAHQLSVLQAVCRWREQQAREQDVPRSRIIKDNVLYDIALKLPNSDQQLKRIEGIPKVWSPELIQSFVLVIQGTLENEAGYLQPLDRPLASSEVKLLKQLKRYVASVAEKLDIPAELLVRKKDYELLIRSVSKNNTLLPDNLQQWRYDIIGKPLMDHLQSLSPEV